MDVTHTRAHTHTHARTHARTHTHAETITGADSRARAALRRRGAVVCCELPDGRTPVACLQLLLHLLRSANRRGPSPRPGLARGATRAAARATLPPRCDTALRDDTSLCGVSAQLAAPMWRGRASPVLSWPTRIFWISPEPKPVSAKTNKQRNKETKKQRNKETKKQRNKETKKQTGTEIRTQTNKRAPERAARPRRALSAPARQSAPGRATPPAIAAAAAARTEMHSGLHVVRVRLRPLQPLRANKQTNEQTNKRANIQTNEQASRRFISIAERRGRERIDPGPVPQQAAAEERERQMHIPT
jgi:hypothetical protein